MQKVQHAYKGKCTNKAAERGTLLGVGSPFLAARVLHWEDRDSHDRHTRALVQCVSVINLEESWR